MQLEWFSCDHEKWIGKCSLFVLSANSWKDQNMASLFSRHKKNPLIWRRHCLIGQPCSSMTSKRSIGWFVARFRAWSFFTRGFALPTDQPYAFDKPIKSLYFRSFVVSVMFARFDFKVIRIKIALNRHACGDVFAKFLFHWLKLIIWYSPTKENAFFFHPYLFLMAFLRFAFFFRGPGPNSQQLLLIRVNLYSVKLFS